MNLAELRIEITPEPTEEEMAAIVAALEATLPSILAPAAEPTPRYVRPIDAEPSRWRFAGRWWSKPVPLHK